MKDIKDILITEGILDKKGELKKEAQEDLKILIEEKLNKVSLDESLLAKILYKKN